MADPPSTPPQGRADGRRAAPPVFAASVGNPSASPLQSATPSPPPHFRPFGTSPRVGRSEDKQNSAVILAESDVSASPTETQESSKQFHSNGLNEGRDAGQSSDGKSRLSHKFANGGNDPFHPDASSPAVPPSPPPSNFSHRPHLAAPSSQFPGPPNFASPLRPVHITCKR